jgi:hypothetical protein
MFLLFCLGLLITHNRWYSLSARASWFVDLPFTPGIVESLKSRLFSEALLSGILWVLGPWPLSHLDWYVALEVILCYFLTKIN